ncbi:MarC family protein [Candidatus Endoriftia persephonae]|jgi:multiple antibiotic resistance protein|uniref:UPF0056 membrane protein n=2 Tax=Gammaproteobacteria TaxID=1236 RepID=G2FCU5_9GAMM|nr:MarC family protein [Candidatus Endoriftia persephone]EGW55325.1 multiple antibiotic resistance (MarC)-related protein [endosymbiont of Tevnia jerichonana (vent Tica)]USF88840.1 MarC family protein [Candidatus Endoriftia persephone]
MEILSIAITLFLIMDPFGNIPVFLSILARVTEERRRVVLARELLLALVVILLFVFFGGTVMSLFGLSRAAVTIASGAILFLIALRLVFPEKEAAADDEFEDEPLLVPLAVPLIAGPSLLAVLLVFTATEPDARGTLLIAALLAWLATSTILLASTFLYRVFSRQGLEAIARLMGMILIALAVQFLLDGVSDYLSCCT